MRKLPWDHEDSNDGATLLEVHRNLAGGGQGRLQPNVRRASSAPLESCPNDADEAGSGFSAENR